MFCKPCPAVVGAVAALTLTLVLSACQADSGTSPDASDTSTPNSPSSSPSADPKRAAIEERAADAEQRHREFLDIRNSYAKKGKDPFVKLLNDGYLGNADIQESEQSFWADYVDLGLKQVGESHIESVDMTGYDGDPQGKDIAGHRVHFEVCMDNTEYDVVRPDGSSAIAKGPRRLVMGVVMQGQPSGLWSVSETQSTGKEC